MKIIWWLIQINAALSVYLVYLVGNSDASNEVKYFTWVVLLVAALLEYFGYYRLYKPIR